MAKELADIVSEQPKKGLFNSIKNAVGRGFRSALLLAMTVPVGLGLGSLAGCKPAVRENYAPTAITSASPVSGPIPFSPQIIVEGEDPDGESDIVEYSAFADYNQNEKEDEGEEIFSPQSTPINASYAFTKPGSFKVYGKVVDSVGHESQVPSDEISALETPEPPINHAPIITSTPITQINENTSYSYQLTATDADGDELTATLSQTPSQWLSISSPTVSNGSTIWTISETSPDVEADINFNTSVDVSDGEDSDIQDYELKVKNVAPPDYLDVSGKIIDCGTRQGMQGRARVYDANDPNVIAENYDAAGILEEIVADNEGNFLKRLNKTTDELPGGVVLRARLTDSDWANGTSYVATKKFLQGDVTGALIETVPYNSDLNGDGFKDLDFDKNGTVEQTEKENCKRHVELTNGGHLAKFDIGNFQGVEIMDANRDGTGHFDPSIEGGIKNDLAQLFDGEIIGGELYIQDRLIPVSIVSPEDAHYINFSNRFVYEPYETIGSGILGSTSRFTTNCDWYFTTGALIRLVSNASNNYTPLDYVRLHEAGHGSNLSPGESYWRTNEMPSPNSDFIDPIVAEDGTWNGLTVMQTGIPVPSTSTIGVADLIVREISQSTIPKREEIDNYLGF
ncbi:MAG: hypothetical protein PHH00_01375 [Candidatus Nanoarchaeia archaeon]|nr:hypothetical protein [Candidatus Nanoarchaeia archaeon]